MVSNNGDFSFGGGDIMKGDAMRLAKMFISSSFSNTLLLLFVVVMVVWWKIRKSYAAAHNTS